MSSLKTNTCRHSKSTSFIPPLSKPTIAPTLRMSKSKSDPSYDRPINNKFGLLKISKTETINDNGCIEINDNINLLSWKYIIGEKGELFRMCNKSKSNDEKLELGGKLIELSMGIKRRNYKYEKEYSPNNWTLQRVYLLTSKEDINEALRAATMIFKLGNYMLNSAYGYSTQYSFIANKINECEKECKSKNRFKKLSHELNNNNGIDNNNKYKMEYSYMAYY